MFRNTCFNLTGSYTRRQLEANRLNCDCYIEQHFNSVNNSDVNYACVIIADNASKTSEVLARNYLHYIKLFFGIETAKENGGIIKGGFGGRGNSNLKHTKMPAILLEPMFLSNYGTLQLLEKKETISLLAYCIKASINDTFDFPNLKIGFSIGHFRNKYMGASSGGAIAVNGKTEAYYSEKVINRAIEII